MHTLVTLPQILEETIMNLLYAEKNMQWKQAAVMLSERYRKKREEQFVTSYDEALAYLALRFPSTYAQLIGTYTMVSELVPTFRPQSMLDIGSGPGTGIIAAKEIWPSITTALAIEKESNFIEIGKSLIKTVDPDVLVEWVKENVTNVLPREEKFDVIVLGNILNELNYSAQRQALAFALRHSNGFIIVTEPGTPYGYDVVEAAARFYLRKSIPIIAPYINNSIPKKDDYWIHFSKRVNRPEFQRSIRHLQRDTQLMPSDWEDVKFSFMVAGDIHPEVFPVARLLEDPKIVKGYIEVFVLTENGTEMKKILKRDKATYQIYRKLRRGDIIFA